MKDETLSFRSSHKQTLSHKLAQVLGEWLSSRKSTKVQDLVAEAGRKGSPLAKLPFEWDDTHAGAAYRLEQARQFIRSVVQIIPGAKDPIRAVVSVSDKDETSDAKYAIRRYVPISVVEKRASLREQVVNDAIQQLHNWLKTYRRFERHFGLVPKAIKELIKEKRKE